MTHLEMLLLWAVVILLVGVSLTTGKERASFVLGLYRRAVNALKDRQYMRFITGGLKKGKRKIHIDENVANHDSKGHKDVRPTARDGV